MGVTVTLAEIEADFGRFRERAGQETIRVLENGREIVYLVPPDRLHSLKQGSRRALSIEELSEQDWEMIATAEIPEAERYEIEDDG